METIGLVGASCYAIARRELGFKPLDYLLHVLDLCHIGLATSTMTCFV